VTAVLKRFLRVGAGSYKYLYQGKEIQNELGLDTYDFHARMYDPVLGRTFQQDPLADLYYSHSSYSWVLNNPIKNFDPTGMSTHTDSSGVVVAVYDDGNNSVYRHNTLPENYAQDDAGIKYKTVKDKDGNKKKVATNTLSGGENMGETEFWDEFISPETGSVMTSTRIQFGRSWNPIISEMADNANGMNLEEIAANSGPGGLFDIKVKYSNQAGLLNGKYATARSAGNYLAGYNAKGGTMYGIGITFTTFQKLAGALHVKGSLSAQEKKEIVLKGKAYGSPPTYGEETYQYRMSKLGWQDGRGPILRW
jgi:RHS repeat-associated protein